MRTFRNLVREVERKGRELSQSEPISIARRKQIPAVPGVYVISSGKHNLYAGLAKNLRRRLTQHANGKQIQSAFTLRLAKNKFRLLKHKKISLRDLRKNKEFKKVYGLVANKVRLMNARYVQADKARLRIILEVYAGIAFNTKWNDFNVKDMPS